VVDASAKLTSGFVTGNNFWLGSAHQCHSIVDGKVKLLLSDTIQRNVNPELLADNAPFIVEMKFALVETSSAFQGIWTMPAAFGHSNIFSH
jgi:Nose resistant-to-fluoxetine protein, N-terminal domain